MLQKYNSFNWLAVLLAVAISVFGCSSTGKDQSGSAHATNMTQSVPQVAPANQSESPPENLSAKTIVPVGFEKFMGIFTPYRTTIQQGNFVSKEMLAQVKQGMTREQVRFLLGTPLLTDMFHSDRWDYMFRLLKPNGELTTSRVTVYFEKNLVSTIEHGDLPTERDYLAEITDGVVEEGSSQSKDKKRND